MGKRDDRQTSTMMRRFAGQSSTGPKCVADQSVQRKRSSISPCCAGTWTLVMVAPRRSPSGWCGVTRPPERGSRSCLRGHACKVPRLLEACTVWHTPASGKIRTLALGAPDDERLGGRRPGRTLTRAHRDDLASGADGKASRAGGGGGLRRRELVRQLLDPRLQGRHVVLEVEDALDAGQRDALLRQPLHLAQQLDVTGAVATSTSPRPRRGHQAQ